MPDVTAPHAGILFDGVSKTFFTMNPVLVFDVNETLLDLRARTAFIARPGRALDPLAPRPEIVGRDLAEVAAQMIAAR